MTPERPNRGAADRYVLILTADEWDRIAGAVRLVATIPKFKEQSAAFLKKIEDIPSGDAAMLLDAAEDGCSNVLRPNTPSTLEEYAHVADFVTRLREHWKP